jgi:glycine/D-amino acid oxidase-like deaminating enzyme
MTDFIIVGQGLAAHVLMHNFQQRGITFTGIGNPELSSSSRVAAGIWNPVVFKRMTKSWLADDLIPYLNTFYTACETALQQTLITQRPILKPFTETHEKALWLKKSGMELRGYLEELDAPNPLNVSNLKISNGYGVVKRCGSLDVAKFLTASSSYFKEKLSIETFDHARLKIFEDRVEYGTWRARNVVFCEGYLVQRNPFFSWLPLKPAKGEVLTVALPEVRLQNAIFNRNGFLMDTAAGIYKTGATYEWQDLRETPTEKGRLELIARLELMTESAYSIQKHEAGIRPSSIDRRPLIGRHPAKANVFVFNGLGTKGVMLAPFFANNFVNFYLQKEPLHREADISRFYSLYETNRA